MEKYFKRKSELELSPPPNKGGDSSKKSHVDINLSDLPLDPELRPRIMDYNPNDRETKFVELIYNRVLVNPATIIFHKNNLVLNYYGLTKLGFLNLVTGLSIV